MAEPTAEQKGPAALSDAYHKARRSLALFSGILIAWEYVGISVGDPEAGATGTLPGDVTVAIRNPEVVPVVIVLLVLFFAARLTIEWWQCDPHRRELLASRVDLFLTFGLAGFSVLIFLLQQVFSYRLADFLTEEAMGAFILAFFMVFFAERILSVRRATGQLSGSGWTLWARTIASCVLAFILMPFYLEMPELYEIPFSIFTEDDAQWSLLDGRRGVNVVAGIFGIIVSGSMLRWALPAVVAVKPKSSSEAG